MGYNLPWKSPTTNVVSWDYPGRPEMYKYVMIMAVALVLGGCGSLAFGEAPAPSVYQTHPECFGVGEPARDLRQAVEIARKCEETAYQGLGIPEKGIPDLEGFVLVQGADWREVCLWNPRMGSKSYRPWWLKDGWGYSFFAHPEYGWDPEIEMCGETPPTHRRS